MAVGKMGSRGGFGSSGALGRAGVSPQPVTYVTNFNSYNTGNKAVAVGREYWLYRIPAQTGGPVSELAVEIPTRRGNAELVPDNSVTFTKIALEYNGVTVPVTFSGSRSLTYTSASAGVLTSDAISASAFGVSFIPADATIYRRFYLAAQTAATNIPIGLLATATGGQSFQFAAASDQVDATGAMTTPSGAISGSDAPTVNIVGRFKGAAYPVWAAIGDSLTRGYADAQSGGTGATSTPGSAPACGTGYFNRASVDGSSLNVIAGINLAIVGEAANTFVGSFGSVRRSMLARVSAGGRGRAVEFFGTNDIGTTGTPTAATVEGNLTTLNGQIRAAGISKVITLEFYPRTSSTDAWLTKANQTPIAGWASGGVADQVNAWRLAAVGSLYDAMISTRGIAGDNTDTTLWKTDGVTANLTTADGIHPLTATHVAVAALVRAAMLTAA